MKFPRNPGRFTPFTGFFLFYPLTPPTYPLTSSRDSTGTFGEPRMNQLASADALALPPGQSYLAVWL